MIAKVGKGMELCYGIEGKRRRRCPWGLKLGAVVIGICGVLLGSLWFFDRLYPTGMTAQTSTLSGAAAGVPLDAGTAMKIHFAKLGPVSAVPNGLAADLPVSGKTVYLTFDDGPSKTVTPQVLEILKRYGIKGNFFVIGELCKYHRKLVQLEREEGHSVCNHTYSHEYKWIYANVDRFMQDIQKCDQELRSTLGEEFTCKYIRFPGGGYGKKYAPFKEAAVKAGYTSVYWDVESGDAEGQHVPAKKLLGRVKQEMAQTDVANKKRVVLLMHDAESKNTTVDSLPAIIEYLKSAGYSFATFDEQPYNG